jgi:hypothetical protein
MVEAQRVLEAIIYGLVDVGGIFQGITSRYIEIDS